MNYVKPTDTALVAKDDLVEMHGVRVYVDPKATFFVVGTTMDYEVRIYMNYLFYSLLLERWS